MPAGLENQPADDSRASWFVTTLGSGNNNETSPIQVHGVDGRRVSFSMAGNLRPGTVCKLNTATYLIIGEIVAAERGGDLWLYTLYIHHSLRHQDIEYIRRRWTE